MWRTEVHLGVGLAGTSPELVREPNMEVGVLMTKRCGMLVALALAAAFIAGCGSSSSPSAVDTVAPAAVLNVEAQFVQGVIEVTWAPGSEADLVGYRVYRSTNGAAATLAGVSTSTTFEDASIDAPSTSPRTYRYEITAVDEAGNESPRASTVQVFVAGATPRGHLARD